MRRSTSGMLLLSCFVMSLITNQIIYNLQRTNAYNSFIEQKVSVDQSKVITISLPVNTIRWEKLNKEFYYNGKLYDVLSIDRNAFELIISCIADHAEDAIVGNYIKTSDAKSKEKINPPVTKDQRLPSGDVLENIVKIEFKDFIAYTASKFLKPGLDIFIPPPERIIASPVDLIC